jgi:aryl-alcohol dehydrogenase-like predicted oxidoreductase/histidinol phosphatase-like enzyme
VIAPSGERPLAMGCMRLSTEPDRDDARAVATLHAALEAGVTLLDTADAYAWDAGEIGHNERLIARALATWQGGDAGRVRVATKGGLTRPGGRWVPDGRARHLAAAARASRTALGVERVHLYQLHAPDPRTSLATSLRALRTLQQDGVIEHIGLCNVTRGQLIEACGLAPIAAVQVELSPWHDESLRGGIAEVCAAEGILLLAHRPLGGVAGRRRLEQEPVLRDVGRRHAATPAEVALAWLRSLADVIVPLPGATSPEHAGSLARAAELPLSTDDLAELDARFPAGRLLRAPRAARRPPDTAAGDVVLVIGLPGAGKSTIAAELVQGGHERLNRDEAGGRLADLLPALESGLAAGRRRFVLDNTYGSRAARNAVIEAAWAHGAPARCVWLQTSMEDAQVNAVQRMLARYGRLLEPEELRRVARQDPGAFAPQALFRHRREFEPPDADEGFSRVDAVAFRRRTRPPDYASRALIVWYDGVVRKSRSGARTPASAEDVDLLPGRRDVVRRHADDGWLVLGVSWQPEIATGKMDAGQVDAALARTRELLGVDVDAVYCPHADGPPVCWCRKPLPGLGVVLIERHRLDPARCVYVGREATDQAFARTLGFTYRDAEEMFAASR